MRHLDQANDTWYLTTMLQQLPLFITMRKLFNFWDKPGCWGLCLKLHDLSPEHAFRVCEGGVNMFAMKIIFHLTTFLTCFATFWGDDDSGGWICCGVARYFVYSDISSPRKPCKITKNICQLKVRSISDRYRYLPFVSSRCTCSYCWLMMGEDVWEKTLHWSVVTRPDDTGPGWSRSVQFRDSDIMIIVIIALSLVECVEPPGSAELS